MAAFILTIGEKCYDWASRGLCEYPCQHGCDLALGMLEHGAFVSASLPDQIFTAWPPLYAFFVFPFFWAGDGHSLLLAVIVQAVLVFAVGLLLRRAVDMYFPGFGLLIMGLFIFNPNVFAIALVPKADTIFALTLALAFVSLLYYLKDGRGWRVALAGALIDVATLIRPTAQYLGVLLPIVSTDCAAAKEPINKARSASKPVLIEQERRASIASPAPILSTILVAKAGQ